MARKNVPALCYAVAGGAIVEAFDCLSKGRYEMAAIYAGVTVLDVMAGNLERSELLRERYIKGFIDGQVRAAKAILKELGKKED